MAFQMKMPAAQTDDVRKSLKQIHSWLYQLNENLHYTFAHLDEENFTDAFLKSLSRPSEDVTRRLDEMDKALDGLLGPGVWTSFSLKNANVWSSVHTPVYCVRGRCVFLVGGFSLKATLNNRSVITVAELPPAIRPPALTALTVGSDSGSVRLTVNTDGTLTLRNTTGAAIGTGTYISLACSYSL